MAFWSRAAGASWIVRTTVARRADAERLARRLVEGRLAACVHIAEVASVYRWDGRLQQETEFAIEARTTAAGRHGAASALLADHPYKLPLVEQVEGRVNAAYAAWMDGEVR